MEPVLDRQRGSRLLVPLPSDKKTAQQRPGRGCAPARQLGEQALTAAWCWARFGWSTSTRDGW